MSSKGEGGTMKQNFFMMLFVGICIFFGFRVMTTARQLHAGSSKKNLISVPSVNKQYTIQALLNAINQNNPMRTSTFLVPTGANGVLLDDDMTRNVSQITGSQSIVALPDIQNLVQQQESTMVNLKTDPALITYLASQNRLDRVTTPEYQRILLYFILGEYRLYINDPFPGKIVHYPGLRVNVNPAANIIAKWNLNSTL